jgi:prevent-host-death family protein
MSVTDARAQFSRVLKRVASGEEIVITRSGQPIAMLLSFFEPKRQCGSAKGEFRVPDDFNDPLPKEIEDLFYGE